MLASFIYTIYIHGIQETNIEKEKKVQCTGSSHLLYLFQVTSALLHLGSALKWVRLFSYRLSFC